ncbi:hypothetical protein Taro_003670, partial [Colocasia esculenta]|nr:hypothetical protein [Colocasia esculenta]
MSLPAALVGEGLVIPTGPCSRGSPPYFLQLGARRRGSSVSDGLRWRLWGRVVSRSRVPVRGGTGVCGLPTSWRVQGPEWFCVWALDPVKVFLVLLSATASSVGFCWQQSGLSTGWSQQRSLLVAAAVWFSAGVFPLFGSVLASLGTVGDCRSVWAPTCGLSELLVSRLGAPGGTSAVAFGVATGQSSRSTFWGSDDALVAFSPPC